MKISVLAHNLDRAEALGRCLDSVMAQTHRPLEAVILDAGSTDGSLKVIAAAEEKMRRAGLEVRVLRPPMMGVGASRNLAARSAGGEILCFLDNDGTLPDPAALARLAGKFAAVPSLAVVSFRVLLGDSEEPDPSCWIYRRSKRAWCGREFETFTFTGGASAIRTEVFWRTGGFWEELVYSREEEDLALALIDQGWKIIYSPEVTMRHYPDLGGRRLQGARRAIELQNGLLVWWRRLPIPAAAALGLARIATMLARLILRREGSPLELLKGLPQAVRQWRENGFQRRSVGWAAVWRYIELNLKRRG